MMEKTLNAEEMNMVNGGKDVTTEEMRETLKNDKASLDIFNMADKVHEALDDLGIKHDYHLEIHE